jgi:hypothetical protein
MRDQTLWGPTNGDPLQHGHVMATRMEDYIRYAPGEERQAITDTANEQQNWADEMLAEYQARWPEQSRDIEGLNAAVSYTMNQLKWHGENPARWARANPEEFLRDVSINHSAGLGRDSAGDSHRTAGIISSGSAARPPQPADTMSDTDFVQQMQRAKGIY